MRAFSLALLLATLAWAALGCAEPASEPQDAPLPDRLEVELLTDGVWLHTSWRTLSNGSHFPSHGLVVRHPDGLTLVDTAWGEALTEDLFAWIDRELDLPVTHAVATHFHDDRLGGAAILEERSIEIMAHPLTPTLQSPDLPKARPISAESLDAYSLPGVIVHFPGAAHTRDNLVAWLPGPGILFGGCAIRPAASTGMGNTADADLDAWPRTVERLIARFPDARLVIPSHGPPGGPDLLRHTLELAKAVN